MPRSVTATSDGAVRVTYASTVASPYPLPDFVIRTVLATEMADSMRTLRRRAAEPEAPRVAAER